MDPVEDVPVPPVAPQVTPFWSRRKKAPDLPLDEAADPAPAAETARKSAKDKTKTAAPPPRPNRPQRPCRRGEKAHFFDHTSHVRRPDQVLEDLREEAVPPTEEGPLWRPVGEAKPTKAQRQAEIQQEAHAVTQTIEKTLEESQGKDYVFPLPGPAHPAQRGKGQGRPPGADGDHGRLSGVLTSFGIDGHVTGAVQGPAVTRYEVALEQGVRLNKLTNLSDDVALALGVTSVRIAPVPGKISVVGIEVPNQVVIPVPIREVLESPAFRRHKSSVAFSVGKDIGGNYIVGDCSKLPHMLIAGTTGSGKSVCINSLLISMLYKSTPGGASPDHGGPQDGGAGDLQRHPPPADPRGHRPQEGGRGPPVGGDGDDEALPPLRRGGGAGTVLLQPLGRGAGGGGSPAQGGHRHR